MAAEPYNARKHAYAVSQQRRQAEAATLAALRAGTHVVVPLGHQWTVARHDETGTSSVTFHYRDDGFAKADATLTALTSAAPEAPSDGR